MTQQQIAHRFSRALSTYDRHAIVQQHICHHLIHLLDKQGRKEFPRLLEIGCGSAYFTRLLHQYSQVEEWVINDLCPDCEPGIRSLLQGEEVQFMAGDASHLLFPGKFDLIASASAIQWIENLPAFIEQIASLLPSGGLFLGNVFAPDNLQEIKELTGQGLSYPTLAEWEAWLSPYFHIHHLQEEQNRLTFQHPTEVLKHLKYTGVTATNSAPWTRKQLERFTDQYLERFSCPEGVPLTYRPLYIVAERRK
ncbi:malonyl-CoA O-methyltransferase [Parabacteroides sp. PFB2-12]|uniref:malonyl-ACP O-methyltransferase BioC n=1 Tax=unclassified Parabacteroides TaxID=2649774 RepID=UPI002476371D|nr:MULTISPECIES: malonyl-ACP O-methyltransferase BioC [unclassified Parabacteroides]MDH6343001.1 malonyl-CoA O-methyltransferase [Parabacteroides sp. PM6-13]MDH6390984.1 malonyl-CoA O-methyltransferase [Parabacteroides sp. PFB2-12]